MYKLTNRQKVFIDEYIISLNASEAAVKAGYSPRTAGRTAHENLKKPEIQKAIQKRLEKKENNRIAKQNEILEHLTAVMRGEKEGEVKDTLKAAELLGKTYGIFTDKLNLSGEIGVKIIDDIGTES